MANQTVKLVWGGSGTGPGGYQAQLGASYTADVNGFIYVAPNDIVSAINAGWAFAVNEGLKIYAPSPVPAAANAVATVASVALTNGTLTIAAQPEVPRPLAIRIDPGAAAITAGSLVMTYAANDGTPAQVDTISLVAAVSTPFTTAPSKGVLNLSSAVVSGLVGGSSPKIQIGTTAAISLPTIAGAAGLTVLNEKADGTLETVGAVVASTGQITPTTAPNGTHTYSFGYTYTAT